MTGTEVAQPGEAEASGSIATMIGASYSGAPKVAGDAAPEPQEPVTPFEFDADFQSRVVYLAMYDQTFMRKVAHLLRPEYFESAGDQAFMIIVMKHWKDYQCVMADKTVLTMAIKDAIANKLIRKEQLADIMSVTAGMAAQRDAMRAGEVAGLNADYVADKVAEFVRRQAVVAAVMRSVDLIEKRDYPKIEKLIADATNVGIEAEEQGGDYFERLVVRTNERADESAGKKPPRGITTGHGKMDALLYHRGWGRKELNVIMGGAKAGKTTALIEFGSAGCMAGFNVLYVTLEVSNRIIEERADARFTDTPIADLVGQFSEVNRKVTELATKGLMGRFYIAEFPSGSMSPSMLKALLERHKAKGWFYDMVVVDYADIMSPDYRTQDPIENSKQVYIGLRAIAQEWNVVMLTATQSNREGFKSVTAKAEHVSDDFNKVRTADLFISINSTEEERRDGKARLFFAASRNQRSGMTIFIEQDFSRGRFLKAIERIE